MKQKFSKDPKVELISLKDFFELSNYLFDVKRKLWKEIKKPSCGIYYKITSSAVILINYTLTTKNFGLDFTEKLDYIQIAYRDGKTEFDLLNNRLQSLLEHKKSDKESELIDKSIKNLEDVLKLFKQVKFAKKIDVPEKKFEDYLIDVKYKTCINKFKGKYVVFDTETNGVRTSNDDLLSISIYDPTSGMCYNRFVPLELQPLVLTGWIHGIKDRDLEKHKHITQTELDKVIEYFDLKNKTLLSFSGGQGTFDSSFIINYCKRHNLVGFENLKYENIKSLFPRGSFGTEGQVTKDNLCKLLKIDGAKEIHSSINDCVLEWKLFEKIKDEPLFFIKKDMFKYHNGYIVPVSYLNNNPELATVAKITIPPIIGKAKMLFEYSLPKNILRKVKKFPTNITGIALENGINSVLNVEKQDNSQFLAKNRGYLEYIGSLECRLNEIPIALQEDGTICSLDDEYDDYIEEVNKVTKIIIKSLTPVYDFIKTKIFTTDKILSQELSISRDGKVLALCDLSNDENVLEIKTFKVTKEDGEINNSLAKQLYYESKGRKTFVLSIDFDQCITEDRAYVTNAVNIRIYHIVLEELPPVPKEGIRVLRDYEIKILKMMKENPTISKSDISKNLKFPQQNVSKIIEVLKFLKYIKKEDETKRKSKWLLLRKIDDTNTRYSIVDGKMTLNFS